MSVQLFSSANGGTTWTSPPTPPTNLYAIQAMATSHGTSSSGANVVVCRTVQTPANVGCYFSTDAGATFVPATTGLASVTSMDFPQGNTIAMSSTGAKVLVATLTLSRGASGLYLSTNSGADYTALAGPGPQVWLSVAMSSDGNKMAAMAGSSIWTSIDGGSSWTSTNLPFTAYLTVSSLAMSGDGTQLLAATAIVGNGLIYTSSDFGSTWTLARKLCDNVFATCTDPSKYPTSCRTKLPTAVSQTGSVMAVSVFSGGLYISTDTGSTWAVAQ